MTSRIADSIRQMGAIQNRSDSGLVVVEPKQTGARRLNHATVRRMFGRGPSTTDITEALEELERSATPVDDARRLINGIISMREWTYTRNEQGQWSAAAGGFRFNFDTDGIREVVRNLTGEPVSERLARNIASQLAEAAVWGSDL